MKIVKRLGVLVAFMSMLAGCANGAGSGLVEKISFNPNSITLKVNETKKIPISFSPSNAGNDISYLNLTQSIIEVDFDNNTVKGLKLGQGKLKASSISNPNKTALLTVNVSNSSSGGGSGDSYTGSYYNSISDSLTGQALTNALHTLNDQNRKIISTYKGLMGYFKYTDYDPTNAQTDSKGQKYSNTYVGFYDNYKSNSGSGMNREHVWPDSRGGNLVETDIHMVRPTRNSSNSDRGNSFYVEGMNDTQKGWDPANYNVPSYRGDAARIIFYCCIANTSLTLVDSTNDSTGNKTMGKLSDLIRWHLQYPVDPREQRRNDGAEYLQGNRNPFIDHPSYVCRIWGNTNSQTRAICGM